MISSLRVKIFKVFIISYTPKEYPFEFGSSLYNLAPRKNRQVPKYTASSTTPLIKYKPFPHSSKQRSPIMLAITGTTGKIGGAVLDSLLTHSLLPPVSLVICTSSSPVSPQWDVLKARGVTVRYSNYSDPSSMVAAFAGCDKLFLVSTPIIAMDYAGEGRERHHFAAIAAAQEAGVKHIYYTSLAFGGESEAGVMRAHLRTEELLRTLPDVKFTVLREGLYNESWPLYFGYYDIEGGDEREEVVVAGDGPVSWTSIADLGLASAMIVADESEKYTGKTLYLSASRNVALNLRGIAEIVGRVRGKEVRLKIVGRDEYVKFYTGKEGGGKERASVEWWVSSYAALEKGECEIGDNTLDELLASKGLVPKVVEETIGEILGA